MVMVIGSSHSTLKDTLPTLIKIEKVKNLRLKYISNTVSNHLRPVPFGPNSYLEVT